MNTERRKYGDREKGVVLNIGDKRGRLTLIEEIEPKIDSRNKTIRRFLCKCDCGNEVIKTVNTLRYGVEPSCGCALRANIKIGDKFGHLTILEELPKRRKGEMRRFLCQCDCGNTTTITYQSLHKDVACKDCTYKDIIGRTRQKTDREKLYIIWHAIKNRTKHKDCYVRKGISICKEWLESFESFYQWSINNGYKQGLSIDRIDNFGNYEPDNCRWTTSKVQSLNKEVTRHLSYNGETHNIIEWSELTGISAKNIRQRIDKCKMPVGMALGFEPMRDRIKTPKSWIRVQEFNENNEVIREFESLKEASKNLGIAVETVKRICENGNLRLPRIKELRLKYKD